MISGTAYFYDGNQCYLFRVISMRCKIKLKVKVFEELRIRSYRDATFSKRSPSKLSPSDKLCYIFNSSKGNKKSDLAALTGLVVSFSTNVADEFL